MLPTSISLKNYRSFPKIQTIELRPVTLFYGINNAGKSALIRLLKIISDSVRPEAGGALELESSAVRGSSFKDIRWKGLNDDDDPDIWLSFSWDDSQLGKAEFSLHWFEEWRRVLIRSFKASDRTGAKYIEGKWIPVKQEMNSDEITYQVKTEASSEYETVRIFFEGLIPGDAGSRNIFSSWFTLIKDRLRSFHRQVLWLESSRKPPGRITPYPTSPQRRIRPDGSDTGSVLATQPKILSEVSGWYEQYLKRKLTVESSSINHFRVALSSLQTDSENEFDVDLTDAGEGMIQVMPVLTSLALARAWKKGGARIVAIEEPESHLHPKLQTALASYIAERVREKDSPIIVLETEISEYETVRIFFEGLIPGDAGSRNIFSSWFTLIKDRLRSFHRQVLWLESSRKPPGRITPYPTSPQRRIRPDGSDTGSVLATQPKILSEVSGWYEQYLKRKLTVESSSINHFRVALSSLQTDSENEFDVDLTDAGEGMIQVMPVLTSLALARAWKKGGARIVAIEEPESHLHPKLQTALASYIAERVREKDSPIIVLETEIASFPHHRHIRGNVEAETSFNQTIKL